MSFNEAVTLLGAMRPVQRQVLTEQRAELSLPVAAWQELLAPISRYGQVAVPARRQCGFLLVGGLVLLGLALVSLHSSALLALGLLASGLVVTAGAVVTRGRLVGSSGELLGRIDRFLLPLLQVLEQDVEAGEQVRLRIDLRSARGEMVGAPRQLPKPFANPRLIKVEETCFCNAWLAGTARLADGGALSWQATDLLRRRRIVKKGASGKTKIQMKERRRGLLAVRLALKADAYALVPPAAGPAAAAGPALGASPAATAASGHTAPPAHPANPAHPAHPALASHPAHPTHLDHSGLPAHPPLSRITAVAGERRLVLKARQVVELDARRPEVRVEPLLAAIGGLYARVRRQRPATREVRA